MQGQCARCKGKLYFTELQADSGSEVVCPKCGSVNKLEASGRGGKNEYFVVPAELSKSVKDRRNVEEQLDPERIQRDYDVAEEIRQKVDFSSKHDLLLESDTSKRSRETDKNFRKLLDSEKFADTSEFNRNKFEDEKNAKTLLFERSSSINISYSAGHSEPLSIVSYILKGGVVLFLIAAVYFAFQIFPHNAQKTGDPDHEIEQKILRQMSEDYPAEAPELMTYIKNGETAFTRDNPEAYSEAADNFGKAFVLSPRNDEIVARYAESMILGKKAGGDIKRLQNILAMLDFGLEIKANSASLHRARARFFLSLGQSDNAYSNARHSILLEPENSENAVVYSEVLAENDPQIAIQGLEKIISRDVYPLIALRILADVYFKNGYLAEAELIWKKRLDIDPQSCICCLELANLYESVGLYDSAVTMYRRLLNSEYYHIEGMAGFSRSLLFSGRHPSQVVDELAPFVKKGPRVENMQQLAVFQVTGAHMHILMGNHEKAQKYNKEALSADPSNVAARYQRILLRLIKKDIDDRAGEDMAGELSDLALFMPKSPEIPTLAGRLHELRMEYQEAIGNYLAAIKLDPSYPVPVFLLAALHTENRIYTNAFKTLWGLADFSPDYWEQHPRKDLLEDLSGSGEKLLTLLGRIEKYEVDIDELRFLSGLTAFINRNSNLAAEHFRAVLKNNPEHSLAACWLAYIYIKGNRKPEALSILNRIKIHNQRSSYLKAFIESEGLQLEQRIAMWDNFIRRYERCPAAYVRLAELYYRNRDKNRALAMAQTAFRLDPESLETRSILYIVGK